ncbi:MAG: VOC family protein [Geobacter sp.]|nr:VOC family protein [Geobacter sp.]
MVTGMKNIVVFVSDFDKAKEYYTQVLKLPLAKESVPMLEFFSGTTTLGVVAAFHDDAKKLIGRHTGITLNVQNLDSYCKMLSEAGARFIEPLESTPWGKMAVIADPDGNQFALVEG